MEATDVIELYSLFGEHGIEIWIDGGWGVDALLGDQTRPHRDLDIAVRHSDVPLLCKLLEIRGYRHIVTGGSWACNFVLSDEQGRKIDIHSFELNAEGNNTSGVEYRAEHLTGQGRIGGCVVRCIAPEWTVKFHTGYPLDADDFQDVKAVCDRFGVDMPEEHKAYWQSKT